MNRAHPCATLAFAAAAALPSLSAQTAPAPGTVPPSGPVTTLSVFEVVETTDKGYAATSTLSGTRTNEELKNLPNSISILNRQFLDDVATNDFFEAAAYLVGFEPQEGGAATIGGNSGAGFNVRGIPNNWQSRNGFQWFVPSDNFNTERLESLRGPSGQLYGDIGAGGILNISTKAANFQNRHEILIRLDDWGQRRLQLDANRKLSDRFALRANAALTRGGDWREGPRNNLKAFALASTTRIGARTQLRLDGEIGRIDNRTGHNLLVDGYSDWTPGTGTTAVDVDPTTPGVQQQFTVVRPDPVSGVPTSYAATTTLQAAGNNQRWTVVNGQLFSLESFGPLTGDTSASRVYRATSVDPLRRTNVSETLIPREQQWAGPDQKADRRYHTITALLTHPFGPRLWAELGYNLQWQLNQTNITGVGTVARDPNPFLPAPNAQSGPTVIPNPYYNELYVEHQFVDSATRNTVHNVRATAVYDLQTPWFTQRLVGTGAVRLEHNVADSYTEQLVPATAASLGLTGAAALPGVNRITRRFYLRDGNADDQLAQRPIPGTFAFIDPSAFNARTYAGLWTGAVNAFGAYFNGRLRSSVGVRRDYYDRDELTASLDPATGARIYTDPRRAVQDLYNTSLNYGAVFFVTPQVSAFYNYSETFIANTAGTNFDGTIIDPQQGNGFDAGLRFNLFGDRVSFSATYFDNRNENTRIQNVLGGNAAQRNLIIAELNALIGPTNPATGATWIANGSDTQTRAATGYEFELVANPRPNLTARAALTITRAENEARAVHFNDVFSRMIARVQASGGTLTPAAYANTAARIQDLLEEDPPVVWRPNATARYRFAQGRLRRLAVGGSAFWNDFVRIPASYAATTVVAGQVIPGAMTRPGLKVPSYWTANLFVTYPLALRAGGTWQLQLNVNNVLDRTPRLGGWANGRYPAPRQLIFTNTLTF
jgi:outer membrane receptor protein involved in Fe transport